MLWYEYLIVLVVVIGWFTIPTVISPWCAQWWWWRSLQKPENLERFVSLIVDGWNDIGKEIRQRGTKLLGTPSNATQAKLDMIAQHPWTAVLPAELQSPLARYPMMIPQARAWAEKIVHRMAQNPATKEQADQYLLLLSGGGEVASNV